MLTVLQWLPRSCCFSFSNLLRWVGEKEAADVVIDAHETHVNQRKLDRVEAATTAFFAIQVIPTTSAALFALSIAAEVRSGWCLSLFALGSVTLFYEFAFFVKIAYHTTLIGGKHTRRARAVATAGKVVMEAVISRVIRAGAALVELLRFHNRDMENERHVDKYAASNERLRRRGLAVEEDEDTWQDRRGHADPKANDARQSRWTRASQRFSARDKLFMFKVWPRARLQRRMGYLSGRFAEHAPHWQVYVWMKSFLNLIFVLLPTDGLTTHVAFGGSSAATLALLIAQIRVRPFERRYQNLLESWCLFAELLLMAMGYAYRQFGIASNELIVAFYATSLLVPLIILAADLVYSKVSGDGGGSASATAAAAAAAEAAKAERRPRRSSPRRRGLRRSRRNSGGGAWLKRHAEHRTLRRHRACRHARRRRRSRLRQTTIGRSTISSAERKCTEVEVNG